MYTFAAPERGKRDGSWHFILFNSFCVALDRDLLIGRANTYSYSFRRRRNNFSSARQFSSFDQYIKRLRKCAFPHSLVVLELMSPIECTAEAGVYYL
jgi:hypothetical protein